MAIWNAFVAATILMYILSQVNNKFWKIKLLCLNEEMQTRCLKHQEKGEEKLRQRNTAS